MFGVYIFAAVVCINGLVQAIPVPGHGALEGFCNTNEDCKKKECCVRFGRYPNIRPGLRRFVNGTCETFGSHNSDCFTVNNAPKEIYYESCPCKEGLRCVVSTGVKGKTGTCSWANKG